MTKDGDTILPPRPHGGPRPFQLLIVEDNPAEAELIVERLSAARPDGIDICHALDMSRAWRACDEGAFDCVVLDLQLPDTMGAETILSMRARSPNTAIIAYSGMDNEASRTAALEAGAQDFISKNDADASTLCRSVLRALERRSLA